MARLRLVGRRLRGAARLSSRSAASRPATAARSPRSPCPRPPPGSCSCRRQSRSSSPSPSRGGAPISRRSGRDVRRARAHSRDLRALRAAPARGLRARAAPRVAPLGGRARRRAPAGGARRCSGCGRSSTRRSRTTRARRRSERRSAHYGSELVVSSVHHFRLAAEVLGRTGAVAVAALALVPFAGFAARRRWARLRPRRARFSCSR